MNTSDEDLISGVNGASSHYSVLHIAHEARYEDVKRAYRQLALRLHPDKCRVEGAEDAFKRVGQAFHVLGDDKRRRLYDLQGEDAPTGQDADRESDPTDPMDIFRDLFGGANPGGVFGVTEFDRDMFAHMAAQQRAAVPPPPKSKSQSKRKEGVGLDDVAKMMLNASLLPPRAAVQLVQFLWQTHLGNIVTVIGASAALNALSKRRAKGLGWFRRKQKKVSKKAGVFDLHRLRDDFHKTLKSLNL